MVCKLLLRKGDGVDVSLQVCILKFPRPKDSRLVSPRLSALHGVASPCNDLVVLASFKDLQRLCTPLTGDILRDDKRGGNVHACSLPVSGGVHSGRRAASSGSYRYIACVWPIWHCTLITGLAQLRSISTAHRHACAMLLQTSWLMAISHKEAGLPWYRPCPTVPLVHRGPTWSIACRI